jgi:hypothetical protein
MTYAANVGNRTFATELADVLQGAAAIMPPSPAYPTWRRVSISARHLNSGALVSAEVYEIESEQPEGLVRRLVLNEPGRVRRISSYPSGWRSLDDDSLLALFQLPHRE